MARDTTHLQGGTYPGIHSHVDLGTYTDQDRRAVRALAQDLFITNAGVEIASGPSVSYRCSIVKPTRHYQDRFGLNRELVTIFSPHPELHPRTLDAISAATKYYAHHRLDRLCALLISSCRNIQSDLATLTAESSEIPVIIPFMYEELLGDSVTHLIRNRFDMYLYKRDLFAPTNPLTTDRFFFGMRQTVDEIVHNHMEGRNSSLFGLRKTGKTSATYAITRQLDRLKHAVCRVDCQDPSFHARPWNTALWSICRSLTEEASIRLPSEQEFTHSRASELFREAIVKVRKTTHSEGVLLIIDEIEHIAPDTSPSHHWRTQSDFVLFWQSIRSVYQALPGRFTFLIVGTNPRTVELSTINGVDNPLFQILSPKYIPPFDYATATEMLTTLGGMMGMTFDERAIARIVDMFGGHPLLIRKFCSYVHSQVRTRPVRLDPTKSISYESGFAGQSRTVVEMMLAAVETFYPDEYEMLKWLALGMDDQFTEMAGAEPGLIEHLLKYGIIDGNDGRFWIRIGIVEKYLQSKHKYQSKLSTSEEMLSEISQRRNRWEPQLRRMIRIVMLSRMGRIRGGEAVLSVMDARRREKYKTYDYDDLFEQRRCEVYLNDLRKIIVKHHDEFQDSLTCSPEAFARDVQTVNELRVDAHARPISDQDFREFRLAMSRLEAEVSRFHST